MSACARGRRSPIEVISHVFPRAGAVSQRIPQEIGTGEIGWAAPTSKIDLLIASGFAFADLAIECDCNLASEFLLLARMTPVGPFTEVPPAELYQWVTANVPRQADAVFIGGNGLRAIGAIKALEESLGKPVLTANQILLWKALRLAGTTSMPTQYGRVFTQIKEPRSS